MPTRLLGWLNPWRWVRGARAAVRDAGEASALCGRARWHIALEQLRLRVVTGMPRDGYYRLGLYTPELSAEQRRTFVVGERLRRLWHRFTPPRYHHIFKNKMVFKMLFSAMGFRVARLYGVFDPAWGRTPDGAPLRTADDVRALLARLPAGGLVIKPIESAEGQMVLVLDGAAREADGLVSVTGRAYSADDLVAHMTDADALRSAYSGGRPLSAFLLEERLRPHPDLVRLASETLCCVRIVTFVTDEGGVEVLGTGFKLQTESVGADNLARGGMAVHVDANAGRLGEGVFLGEAVPPRHRVHPVTGARFHGFRLPFWDELIDLAERAALAFPLARAVGWDIAITPDGPAIVEGNPAFGGQLPQMLAPHGLLTESVRAFLDRSGH